jgi:hypothetical protein
MIAAPALLGIACLAWLGHSNAQPAPASRALIQIADSALPPSPVVIAYGDVRFTNPSNTVSTDPRVRRWLVERVAGEKPDAVLLSGDIPWRGQDTNDYAVFRTETASWRSAGFLVSPALGNHELNGADLAQCLENWWTAFPPLRGHRWYSVALGSRMFVLNLDSMSSLLPGSEQEGWIKDQLANLGPAVKFVFLNMHHPPLADFQADGDSDHNPRPNEVALAQFLKTSPAAPRVRFIVTAGHIHNYERFLSDGTVFLVSGGGGAAPRLIHRAPDDLYKNAPDVNYHYVKFLLSGNLLVAQMLRLADPSAATPVWEVKDTFQVKAP